MHRIRTSFLLLIFILGFSLVLSGQATTSLRGHVSDASGAVISGANCELTLMATGSTRKATSDNAGEYQFVQLTPGEYSLKVTRQGFAGVEKRGMNLLVGQPATEDVVLAVATVTENVTVDTNVQPVLNTTDASLGNAFSEVHIESLPIEGRNVPDLLSLQPGVTFLGRTDSNNGTSAIGNKADDSRSGAVNGGHSDQSNITLDGVDVNDINNGYAFTSVLRVTQDSISEFRVTTSNPDAAEGRSSGAQVGLITKGGTNKIHGSAYEYNRSSLFEANAFFNKQQQLASNEPNRPPKLIRNVFGGSAGGPILRDRVFYFANYEGRRDAEGQSFYAGTVPTASFRAGNIQYVNSSGSVTLLTPSQIQGMDPQGIGVNQNVLKIFSQFPMPNDPSQGDSLNTEGYRFTTNVHRTYNTYVSRIDWNLTRNGGQTIFWRGNLQNDDEPTVPAFPGQPPSTRVLTNNKGFAVGYTAVITPNLVNALRYGFTRQGVDDAGLSTQPHVSFAGVALPQAFTPSTGIIIPLHNVVDDISWTKHDHSLQFGVNIRFIDDQRRSNANSFPDGQMNAGWLANGSTVAGNGGTFDPAAYGYPAVDKSFKNRYNSALLSDVGIITEGDAVYNYTKQGAALPLGTPLKRDYRWNEYEYYAQDSWKALKNLTVTYGVRYSLLQPPVETSGTQVGTCKMAGGVCAPFSLTDYYLASAQQAAQGGAANAVGEIGFDLNGRSNGRADFWNMEKKDIGPRIAFAYSPDARDGFWNKIFGEGKSSIRAGYSLLFDHFGAATVNTFDTTGSFGLSSQISNVPGSVAVGTAPRFTSLTSIPAQVIPAAPPGGFPATPDPSLFAISWGLDSKIKTPYSHLLDFSVARELHNGSSIEVAYVGRFAHRLLSQEDVAMPINLSAAGSTYFAEASRMSKLARANTPVDAVSPIPYWEQMFGALTNVDLGAGPASATQNVYQIFQQNLYNETYALFSLDLPDSQTGAGINPNGAYPSYRYYHDQYSALYAWRSIAYSNYHALQVVYRQQFGAGLLADFNYTYSKSMDIASQSERLGNSGSNNYAQIINTWAPNQLYGVSDYDATHQINANYVWDIPVGRRRRFLGAANHLVDALIGGWQTTGIVRWTSGFPFGVNEGGNWPTNWDIEGWATQTAKIPSRALRHGHLGQRFADPDAVFSSFDYTLPGGSGTRNPLRGDGYYDWDAGLNKSFSITERTRLQLRWETFNVTNSVRFDAHSINSTLDNRSNFGNATQPLVDQRKAQFAARFEF